MVSFMSWLLYLWGENLHYPFNRRLDGSQSQSGHCCPYHQASDSLVVQPIAQPSSKLHYPGSESINGSITRQQIFAIQNYTILTLKALMVALRNSKYLQYKTILSLL
jgi:hypothetical protein